MADTVIVQAVSVNGDPKALYVDGLLVWGTDVNVKDEFDMVFEEPVEIDRLVKAATPTGG